jgi:two-component system response regulator FixJ
VAYRLRRLALTESGQGVSRLCFLGVQDRVIESAPVIHIVDDDEAIRDSLMMLLTAEGFEVRCYEAAKDFLNAAESPAPGCLLTDVRMPGMTGIELLAATRERQILLPTIVMTAFGDIDMAVGAMKKGAVDFLVKPVDSDKLIASLRAALSGRNGAQGGSFEIEQARKRLDGLSEREKHVLDGLIKGKLNKTIAHDLGISPRTVESHRARLMKKAHADSVAELVRVALLADFRPG